MRDLVADHLDGDLAGVPNVMREVDGRHAAFAELAFEVVTIREASAEHVVWLGHGLTLRLWQWSARAPRADRRDTL